MTLWSSKRSKHLLILFLFRRLGPVESESEKSYNKPGKEVMEMTVETVTPGDHVPEHAWEHTALRTELLLALGAVVLSILGLARVFPMYLTAISIIALVAVLPLPRPTPAFPFSHLPP